MCNVHGYFDLFTGFFSKDWSALTDWATSSGLYAGLNLSDSLACMRDATGSDLLTAGVDLVGELVNGDGSTKQASRRAKNKLAKGLYGFDPTTGNADGTTVVTDPWNADLNNPWEGGWDNGWTEVVDETTEKLTEAEETLTEVSADLVLWGKCAADIFKNFTKMQENYF